MQSQFFGMVQHPLNSALPMLLVPLITIIVRSLKKSRATAAPAAATERATLITERRHRPHPSQSKELTDMSKPQRKPILNASLPAQFRQIRIVLAREPGHPDGDDEVAYIFVAPVDAEGRIDPKLWRAHREACRVARQRPNEEDQLGHLVYHAGRRLGVPL